MDCTLTAEEQQLLYHLGQAWRMFICLPEQHSSERAEFAQSLHRLQDLVAARAGYRMLALEEKRREHQNGSGGLHD